LATKSPLRRPRGLPRASRALHADRGRLAHVVHHFPVADHVEQVQNRFFLVRHSANSTFLFERRQLIGCSIVPTAGTSVTLTKPLGFPRATTATTTPPCWTAAATTVARAAPRDPADHPGQCSTTSRGTRAPSRSHRCSCLPGPEYSRHDPNRKLIRLMIIHHCLVLTSLDVFLGGNQRSLLNPPFLLSVLFTGGKLFLPLVL
jgi:hypothetical protein